MDVIYANLHLALPRLPPTRRYERPPLYLCPDHINQQLFRRRRRGNLFYVDPDHRSFNLGLIYRADLSTASPPLIVRSGLIELSLEPLV